MLLVQCHGAASGEWEKSPYLLEHSQSHEFFLVLYVSERGEFHLAWPEKNVPFHKALGKSANGAFFQFFSYFQLFAFNNRNRILAVHMAENGFSGISMVML